MSRVTASKLKADVDTILRQVHEEGEQVEVLVDGEVIARIVPVESRLSNHTPESDEDVALEPRPLSPEERERLEFLRRERAKLAKWIARSSEEPERFLSPVHRTPAERAARRARLDALSERIGARWPEGVSALDAVSDIRREL